VETVPGSQRKQSIRNRRFHVMDRPRLHLGLRHLPRWHLCLPGSSQRWTLEVPKHQKAEERSQHEAKKSEPNPNHGARLIWKYGGPAEMRVISFILIRVVLFESRVVRSAVKRFPTRISFSRVLIVRTRWRGKRVFSIFVARNSVWFCHILSDAMTQTRVYCWKMRFGRV
jgi:hypothetical protein